MTKPKTWRLLRKESSGGVTLLGVNGEPIKKPNARCNLGRILNAAIPSDCDLEKFKKKPEKSEAINVSTITIPTTIK